MDEKFRLSRHTALWEEQNRLVKRTIIASLILCVLLLMNVLKPYSADLDERKQINAEIEAYKKEAGRIESDISAIGDFKKVLKEVQDIIRKEPWMKEKNELIETLARINNQGRGNWTVYQAEADQTIERIGAQVHDLVVTPLDDYLSGDPRIAQLMPGLSQEIKTLPAVLEKWIRENLGKKWYRTLESKQRRVEDLSHSFEPKLFAINKKISREMPNLRSKITNLKQEITRLENETDIQAKKELIQALEAKMDKILPEWIRGLISIHQMIQLYPLIILGLVIYVFLISRSLNRHYRAMADMRDISAAVKTDPVFSSLWTLTFRGMIPTVFTILAYIGFVAVMWVLFEAGIDVLAAWLVQEGGGFLDQADVNRIQLAGRLILGAAACFFIIRPYIRNNRFLTT